MTEKSVPEHVEINWQTPEGIKLLAHEWCPLGEAKAVIVIVHGLGDHSGRYDHVVDFFNRSGYAVITYDQRGHGQSGGIRGHSSYDLGAEEIHHFVALAAEHFPQKPIFLYGHSLGGALVLYYGFTRAPKITGAIVTGPGLIPAGKVPAAKLLLARIMSRIYPTLTMDNGLDLSGLSHDSSVIERYKSDPLTHGMISARLGLDLIEKGQWMLEQTSFPVPLLVLQGTADRLVDPRGSYRLAKNLTQNTTFHFYDGFFHEIHNEPEKLQVFDCILEWMESHLP